MKERRVTGHLCPILVKNFLSICPIQFWNMSRNNLKLCVYALILNRKEHLTKIMEYGTFRICIA